MKQLISTDEATIASGQHTKPCSDCPMARKSLPGWLGGYSPDQYKQLAHSDELVNCHTQHGAQCAGMAVYRRNVCKFTLPPILKLEADHQLVFSTPMEFVEHHSTIGRKVKSV